MSTTDTALTAADVVNQRPRPPEPGELGFRDYNPRAMYFVIGAIDEVDVEVVSVAQVRDRGVVTVEEFDDVLEAVADGRLVSYRMEADRLTPWPRKLDTPDTDEVVR
jgi:hypothetical protein